MRRRGPRTPFQPPYRRRDVDAATATATAPEPNHPIRRRTGAIDQRLIEGSQISSPFFNQFRREDDGRSHQRVSGSLQEAQSYGHEYGHGDEGGVDMQLDAFDLELLAQTDNTVDTGSGAGAGPGRGLLRQGRPPKQVSRFFQGSNSHITPHRGLASSSSELELGSSPLTRFQHGRPERNANTGATTMAPHPDFGTTELSSQTEGSPSHLDIEGAAAMTVPEQAQQQTTPFRNMPMSIRGIVLVSVHELPDNFRSMFSFPVFNAIQSKCFRPIYHQNDNIVLAAPTGSGKTVIMELAICRLLSTLKDEQFKVVYQAPTKSLCSERFRDWSRKFMTLGLQCAELTGDTDQSQLRSVQSSQIIITTPEKWDSMTRKWKDHARLMQLVKLFLIDEVHILKETRGATLEAVVSRMKSIGSNVRFVALSTTVPNSEDIATWLGKDATNQHMPAHREHFGEEFRPVKLQKFVYGYQSNGNDFAFDKMCNGKLPTVISTHSCRKPIMIFCCTRNSSVATAKELARLWSMTNPPARLWKGPNKRLEVHNMDLKRVAFHHAGLDPADRHTVEDGFLQGDISIICCTSTLAVGVNLPCHLVIIKNTVGWQEGGCKEYSDLEMMQMLGRAGRPQFDDSAVAVILTRKERVNYYEKLVSGSESLESCLHLHLIDHLNAEIGLGTVTDMESAIRWLAGTFLFVRLRRNPTHYKLKEGASQRDEDEMLRQICEKDINLLQECGLVSTEGLKSTQFGDAMARYYVRFETMRTLLSLKSKATISQIVSSHQGKRHLKRSNNVAQLSKIAEAEEFRDVRLKAGEKSLYKEINRANGIKFPVKVDIALPAHKISLLLQSELGAVDIPDGDQFQKHKFSFQQDKNFVFTHVTRLVRCVIDCQICLQDSVSVKNALELARSFGARVWDSSPWQMKQLDQIGTVAVRKLAAAGITSIEGLEFTEAHQIDMTLSRNPPFGSKLLARVAEFPKLRVSVKLTGKDLKLTSPVKVRFKAEVAFMNDKAPAFFHRRPVYVCFMAETSDGHMIDFRRLSASKLQKCHEIPLSADLDSSEQYITCYAMCDDIAGTLRSAELKPDIPKSFFPSCLEKKLEAASRDKPMMNISRPRSNEIPRSRGTSHQKIDDMFDDDIESDDFLAADQEIDWSAIDSSAYDKPRQQDSKDSKKSEKAKEQAPEAEEPTRLDNGKWACNHKCRDKTACKHLCCRDGLDKPPKASRKQSTGNPKKDEQNQPKISSSITKKDASTASSKIKTTERRSKGEDPHSSSSTVKPSEPSVTLGSQITEIESPTSKMPSAFVLSPAPAQAPRAVVSSAQGKAVEQFASDYGDDSFDDLPPPSALIEDVSKLTRNSSKEGKKKANEDMGIDHGIFDWADDWIDIDEPWRPVQPTTPKENKRKASQHGDTGDKPTQAVSPVIIDLSELDGIDPDNRALDSFHDHQPPKRTAPFVDENDEHAKRAKTQNESSSLSQTLGGILVETTLGNINNIPSPSAASLSKDWDDIDPLLLDEFKDIVNFF